MQPNRALAPGASIDPDNASAAQPNPALTPDASIDPESAQLAPGLEVLVDGTIALTPVDPVVDTVAVLAPSCSSVPSAFFRSRGILQMAPTTSLAPIPEWDPAVVGNSSGWTAFDPAAIPPLPLDEFEDEEFPVVVGELEEFPVDNGEDAVVPMVVEVDEEVESITQSSAQWGTSAGLDSPPRSSSASEVATPEPAPGLFVGETSPKSHLGLFWLFHFQNLLRQQRQLVDPSNIQQRREFQIAAAAVVAATAFASGSFDMPSPAVEAPVMDVAPAAVDDLVYDEPHFGDVAENARYDQEIYQALEASRADMLGGELPPIHPGFPLVPDAPAVDALYERGSSSERELWEPSVPMQFDRVVPHQDAEMSEEEARHNQMVLEALQASRSELRQLDNAAPHHAAAPSAQIAPEIFDLTANDSRSEEEVDEALQASHTDTLMDTVSPPHIGVTCCAAPVVATTPGAQAVLVLEKAAVVGLEAVDVAPVAPDGADISGESVRFDHDLHAALEASRVDMRLGRMGPRTTSTPPAIKAPPFKAMPHPHGQWVPLPPQPTFTSPSSAVEPRHGRVDPNRASGSNEPIPVSRPPAYAGLASPVVDHHVACIRASHGAPHRPFGSLTDGRAAFDGPWVHEDVVYFYCAADGSSYWAVNLDTVFDFAQAPLGASTDSWQYLLDHPDSSPEMVPLTAPIAIRIYATLQRRLLEEVRSERHRQAAAVHEAPQEVPLVAPTPPRADDFDAWYAAELAAEPAVGDPASRVKKPPCLEQNFVSLPPPTPPQTPTDDVELLLWDWVSYLNDRRLHPTWEPFNFSKLKAAMWSQCRLGYPFSGSCRKADVDRLCGEVMQKWQRGEVKNPHAFLCTAMRSMGRARAEQRYKEQLHEQAALQRDSPLTPAPAFSNPVAKAPPADGPVPKAPPADIPVEKARPSPSPAELAAASNAMPPEIEFANRIGVSLSELMASTAGYTQVKAPLSVPPIHTIGKPHFGNPQLIRARMEHGQTITAQAREERLKAQAKPPPPLFKSEGPPPKAAAAPVVMEPEDEPCGKIAPPCCAAPPQIGHHGSVDLQSIRAKAVVPPRIGRHDSVDLQSLEEYNRGELEFAAARAADRVLGPQVKMPPPNVAPPLANMVPQLKAPPQAPPQAKLKAIPPLATTVASPATSVVNEVTPKPPPIMVGPPGGKAHFVRRNMHLLEFSGKQPPATKGPPPLVLATLDADNPGLPNVSVGMARATPAFAELEAVIGITMAHADDLDLDGEEAFLAAIEDEDLEDPAVQQAEARKWINTRSALIALQVRLVACRCPMCVQDDARATRLLAAGDRCHAVLGDATPAPTAAAPLVDAVDLMVDFMADVDAQAPSTFPLSGLLHPAAGFIYLDPEAVRCERQRERLRLLNMPWMPMVMIVDDAVAGVVALVNLHTGGVATVGATVETSAAADGSSSAPPFVAPIYMENLGIAGIASEGEFDFLRVAPPLPVDVGEDEELPVVVGMDAVVENAALIPAADVVLPSIDDNLHEMD